MTVPQAEGPPEPSDSALLPRAWVAGLLSTIVPGLGQAYAGQARRGIGLFVLSAVTGAVSLDLFAVGWSMLGFLALRLWIVVDAVQSVKRAAAVGRARTGAWVLALYGTAALAAMFLVLGIARSFVRAFIVPSAAMERTILAGDHVFADMSAYGIRLPYSDARIWPRGGAKVTRGDVVVFVSPVDHQTQLVKRIIGLPGERVEIREKHVFINDEPLSEPYVVHSDPAINPTGNRDNMAPQLIPSGRVFVMGDNREQSFDSRFWGLVGVDAIQGKITSVYFSSDPASGSVRWERIGNAIR